jgi:cysteine desulfurase
MGLTPAEARSSLRLSLSRLTTDDDISRALEIIPAAVGRLRSMASTQQRHSSLSAASVHQVPESPV